MASISKSGTEFLVNTQTAANQYGPSVTALSADRFVVTWTDASGLGVDASGSGVKGQLFSTAGGASTPVGSEFLVNTQTASSQLSPSVTALSADSFVVTWNDQSGLDGEDGSQGVKGQVFSTAGGGTPTLVGSEFLVNTEVLNIQQQPSVTALSATSFMVTWNDLSGLAGDASVSGVKGQLFSVAGATPTRVGSEFLVNTETLNNQQHPSVKALSADNFVVTWSDQSAVGGDTSTYGVKGQLFSAAGATPTKVGSEFLVNTATFITQWTPSITALSATRFVVTWSDRSGQGGDTSWFGVKGQVFSTGAGTPAPVGSEFLVNTQTSGTQYSPSVTALSATSFVVTWTDDQGDGSGDGVKGQVFSTTGATPTKVGTEFLVNTQTAGAQQAPSVTALSADSFVVTWTDQSAQGDDTSGMGVKGQIFRVLADAVVTEPYNPDDHDNRFLTAANDTFLAHGGDDLVFGAAGDDALQGNQGNDTLHGGQGDDSLSGGKDNDVLRGDEGADWLSGDLGNDILHGGAGADRFVFKVGGGQDWIGDFSYAEGDRILLAPGTAYTVASHQGQVLIVLGNGDQIGLAGVSGPFSADWVVFG